jgi:hypothetical protein
MEFCWFSGIHPSKATGFGTLPSSYHSQRASTVGGFTSLLERVRVLTDWGLRGFQWNWYVTWVTCSTYSTDSTKKKIEKAHVQEPTAQIIANFSPSCPELPVPNLQVQGHLIGLGLKVEFWTETFKELRKIGLNYVIYTMLKYIFVFTFKIV